MKGYTGAHWSAEKEGVMRLHPLFRVGLDSSSKSATSCQAHLARVVKGLGLGSKGVYIFFT